MSLPLTLSPIRPFTINSNLFFTQFYKEFYMYIVVRPHCLLTSLVNNGSVSMVSKSSLNWSVFSFVFQYRKIDDGSSSLLKSPVYITFVSSADNSCISSLILLNEFLQLYLEFLGGI